MSEDITARLQPFVQALQDTTRRCERLMQILSILRQMDDLDDPTMTLTEICRRLVEAIAFELAAENCSLFLLDDAGETLELRAACSPFEDRGKAFAPGAWSGSRFRVGEGIVGTVAKTRKSLRVNDTEKDKKYVSVPNGRVQARSLLTFPLLMREELIGVLNLSHSEPNFFTNESENALSFIAHRAAQILASHRLSERLRQSEEHYRLATKNAGDAFIIFNAEGNIIDINPAGESISGISRSDFLKGDTTWENRIFPEDRPKFVAAQDRLLRTGEFHTLAYRLMDKQGDIHYVEQRSSPFRDAAGNITGVISVVRDVTERVKAEEEHRKLEAQVQHLQKLESLGILSSGIAHDFNNLLVGIMGNAGLALSKLPPDSPAISYLEKIDATSRRAAELTREILAYSGKGSFALGPVHLATLVCEMGCLLEASIGKGVALRYEFDKDIPLIFGDRAQIQQIIMNLITNASDAIGDNEGLITLKLECKRLSREDLTQTYINESLPEGEYVCLEVSDTGIGMDENTLAHIFDPFFTTKHSGRGLGLAAVLGIIRAHKGAIKVKSKPGHGTTFTVLFPILPAEEVPALIPPTTQRISIDNWKGDGTVLVADDEVNIREIAEAALADYGFRVITARDGREAVELFREHAPKIRAVLLDLTMPVMDGQEAFEEIYSIRQDVPVILSSGYSETEAVSRFENSRPHAFIQKPFWPSELVQKLREVLENN